MPADATTWMKLRSPFTVFMMLVSATPTLAINVWVFVIFFFLIDKRDEFQLVNFILKFKAFQFASGVIAAVQAALKLYQCVNVVGLCETAAPGQTAWFPFEIACEPLRVIVVWAAFALLWCGHARGGREEIIALETVRIDAADGELDGSRDIAKLRAAERKGEEMQASHAIDDDEVHAASEAARKKFNASVAHGGFLGYFMLYDLCAFAFCCALIGWKIYLDAVWIDDWMFYLSLYYLKTAYSLLSFPFLLFAVPVLNVVLTHAKATGYDKMGILCPKLSAAQVAKKQQIERELRLRRLQLDHRPGISKFADRAAGSVSANLTRASSKVKMAVHTGVETIKRSGSSIAGSVRGAGSVCDGSVCGDTSSPTTRMML